MALMSNNTGLSLSMAVWLASDEYIQHPENTIGVTTLIRPVKQTILSKRVTQADAVEDVSGRIAARMGQAIHKGVEEAWLNPAPALLALGYPQKVIDLIAINPSPQQLVTNPDLIPVYMEQRAQKQVGPWMVSGQFDFVFQGRLEDIKTTSTYTYINKTNDEKYKLQGSIYRWLNPTIITVDHMAIQYLFTDYSNAMASTPNYPPKKQMEYKIPLLSLGETETYVKNRVELLVNLMDAPEEQMPMCSDEDLWRKEPVFKYYKNPDATGRSTKNFDTFMEAHQRFSDDGFVGKIVENKGEVVACKYCPAFSVCQQKEIYIADGSLKL